METTCTIQNNYIVLKKTCYEAMHAVYIRIYFRRILRLSFVENLRIFCGLNSNYHPKRFNTDIFV